MHRSEMAARGREIAFLPNRGQAPDGVLWEAQGAGFEAWFRRDSFVLHTFREKSAAPERRAAGTWMRQSVRNPAAAVEEQSISLVGAAANVSLEALDELTGKVSFFRGNDPQRWASGLPSYGRLRYKNVFPGIDLMFYGNGGKLEYDFVVAPGADPNRIRLRVQGQTAEVTSTGELRIGGSPGSLHRPLLYQNVKHGKRFVEGSFVELASDTLGFRFGAYDRGQTLVIDPAISLLYSTYAGGIHDDEAWDLVLDSQGNAYLTGKSASQDFPVTANAYQTNRDATVYSAIVMKFNAAGTLIYSTFLGGSSLTDGYAIQVNPDGSVYVGGITNSGDYPVTPNAFQSRFSGEYAAIFAKLSADGSQLLYSTYLGTSGEGYATISKLLLNADGSLWMAGAASAAGLPVSANAFQKTANGMDNLFVAKAQFNASGALQIPYLTYLGGSNSTEVNGLYVDLTTDSSGNLYLGSMTFSGDFPVTSNAYEKPFPLAGSCTSTSTPNSLATVTKFSPDLSQMLYSTVLGGHTEATGGGNPDCNQAVLTIHLDAQENMWLVGTTGMSDFPVTPNAISTQLDLTGGAGVDDFVAELSADGSTLLYSTFLGGSLYDYGAHAVWDSSNNIWIMGTSQSTDFPVTANALQPKNAGGYDVTLTELNPAATTVLYSTYFGGSGDDNYEGQGRLRLDAYGNIYMASETGSTNFPVTPTALQSEFANGDQGPNGYDVFFTILGTATVGPISPATAGNAGDATVTIGGAGFQTGSTCSLVQGNTTIAATSAVVGAAGNSITCTFPLGGAPVGSYNVVVTIPNANPLTESGAFTVTAGTGPNVWLSVVGRPDVRFNTPTTFSILFGNSGDADAIGVPVFVIGSSGLTLTYTGSLITLPPAPNLDYSQVPVSYQINGQTVIPLVLARIPPGGSGSFPIQVSVPAATTSFSIQAYNWAPFASALSQLQAPSTTTDSAVASRLGLLTPAVAVGSGTKVNPSAVQACITDLVSLGIDALTLFPWEKDVACAAAIWAEIASFLTTAPAVASSTEEQNQMSLTAMYAGADAAVWSCFEAIGGNTPPGFVIGAILGIVQLSIHAVQLVDDCSNIAQPDNGQTFTGAGVGAVDPNIKAGPVGDGSPSHYIQGTNGLTYEVAFENQPSATAPAAQVVITDQLDPTKVNLSTVSLASISFGNNVFTLPPGTQNYVTTFNLNSTLNVQMQASVNLKSGLITWIYSSIDPTTGYPPSDPTVGFLPPDTDGVSGQGSVVFSAMPVSGLTTGTAITNQASVVFDSNSPIQTAVWTNTIDVTPPVSSVTALPSTESQVTFPVAWSGTDVGSGIATYSIYVSDNGGTFQAWQSGVTVTTANYTGQPGHTYGFFSIATDGAGNVQAAKSTADASTTVSTSAAGFSLNPSSALVGSGGGSGTITVTAPSSASTWTAASNVPWIELTSSTNGTGNGSVGYQVGATPGGARVGSLTIANLTFPVGETATSIATNGFALYPVTPCRVADTRNAAGPFGGPSMAAGSTRSFTIPQSACNIPSTAVAYSLNITVVPPAALGYLTAWPTGQAQPYVSTLNSYNGATIANAAIVPAGTNGAISIYVSDATDVVIDINGYFGAPATTALAFYPVTPCRIADTRNANGPFGGPSLGAGGTRSFTVPQSSCNIPSAAQAYSLNMTVVPPGPLEYLTTWPTGQTQPYVSTLNALQGQIAANAAIVPAGTNGAISVYVSDPSNVLVDINGYFAPPGTGALYFYPVTPCRIADTRNATGTFGGPSLGAGSTRTFPIPSSSCGLPSSAQTYSLNMTVVPPASLFYLSTWPAGESQPLVSTLNDLQGQVIANAAIVPAGTSGGVAVYVSDATNLVMDVNGYFQ